LGARDPETARLHHAELKKLSDPRAQAGDLLQRVFDGKLSVRALYDARVRGETSLLRTSSTDPDLAEHVADWHKWLTRRSRRPVNDRTADDYLRQLRTLIPEGKPFRRSKLTRAAVERWLDGQRVSTSTRARHYAALRSFVKYLAKQDVVSRSVLSDVDAPSNAPARSKFMPFEQVKQVLAAMPTPEHRAFIALSFGSGLELGVLKTIRVADVVDPANRTLLAPGTKNIGRHRYVIVDAWAWPYVERQIKDKTPNALLFDVHSDNARDEFYSAQIAVGLVAPLPEGVTPTNAHRIGVTLRGLFHTLHDCRHTYAVNRMTGDDGEPTRDLQFIADQLGHSDLQMVSRIYAKHRSRIQAKAEAAHRAALAVAAGGK
jgi:integrase